MLLLLQLCDQIEQRIGNAIAETSTSHYKPVKLATEPSERVFPQDLIVSENDLIQKVLTTVVFLCDEIHELNQICVNKFIPPLIMFGQSPAELASANGGDDDENGMYIIPRRTFV